MDDSEEGKASDVKSGDAKEGRVSDQKPKVQWYRCGERDPCESGGSWLTIVPGPKMGVSQSHFSNGEWGPNAPSHWAAIVDEEPSDDPPVELSWIKSSDQLPAQPEGVFTVVWARAKVLRLATFDGCVWRRVDEVGDEGIICEPDWWASPHAAGGLQCGRPSTDYYLPPASGPGGRRR